MSATTWASRTVARSRARSAIVASSLNTSPAALRCAAHAASQPASALLPRPTSSRAGWAMNDTAAAAAMTATVETPATPLTICRALRRTLRVATAMAASGARGSVMRVL